jgi:protein-tyrosine phosphatase
MSEDPAPNDPRPRPIPNSYWVPGAAVIAGEYPGGRTRDAARRKLAALLDAGVTHWVDLTEEIDPLAPYDDVLVELAEERGTTVSYTRLSIPDMDVPPAERMTEILDAIDAALDAGGTVYVHCWGGIGRTGTTVACWFVRRRHDAEAALEQVQRLYDTMTEEKRSANPHSPQTEAQRRFVRAWREA